MARTYRRTRAREYLWERFGRPGTRWGEAATFLDVPDGFHWGQTFGPGGRRRKRLGLRSWRHAQRIRVAKGLEPERYDREWLD